MRKEMMTSNVSQKETDREDFLLTFLLKSYINIYITLGWPLVLQALHSKCFLVLCGSLLLLTSCFHLALSEGFSLALLRSVPSGVVGYVGDFVQVDVFCVAGRWLLRPAGGTEDVLIDPRIWQANVLQHSGT